MCDPIDAVLGTDVALLPRPASPSTRRVGRARSQSVVLILLALAPYDGLLLIVPHPAVFDAWKEALLVLALGLAVLNSTNRSRPVDPPQWVLPLALLAVMSVFSAAMHPSAQSVFGLKIAFTFTFVAATLLLSPFDRRDRDRMVTMLMVNGAITAFVGIAQQMVGAEALNRLGYEYNEVIRFTGSYLRSFSTFNQPFPFAFFLMIVLLVCLPVALSDRQRLRNRLFLLGAPVLALGMATAFVRGALLGLAVGLVLLMIHKHRVLAHVLMPVPLVVLVLILTGAASPLFSASSLEERVSGWAGEVTSETVSLVGGGIGSTGAAAERFERADLTQLDRPDVYQADNHYVKTLIELGPIGLWLFLWVIGSAALGTYRDASRPSVDPGLAEGIAAATAAALAAATVATYWEIFPADLYYWALLGVAPSLCKRSS